jgi:hypothetical protein
MLRLLLRTRTSAQLVSAVGADLLRMQVLATAAATAPQSAEDSLTTSWMLSSRIQPLSPATAATALVKNSRRNSASAGTSAEEEEDTQGHLPLLLPMCLNLVLAGCETALLKEVAVSLIR